MCVCRCRCHTQGQLLCLLVVGSALHNLRVDRLVEFIGAGEMVGPSGHNQLFNVQEFLSGGSIDTRLWAQPLESVTNLERIVWACDAAEAMEFIHKRGFTQCVAIRTTAAL